MSTLPTGVLLNQAKALLAIMSRSKKLAPLLTSLQEPEIFVRLAEQRGLPSAAGKLAHRLVQSKPELARQELKTATAEGKYLAGRARASSGMAAKRTQKAAGTAIDRLEVLLQPKGRGLHEKGTRNALKSQLYSALQDMTKSDDVMSKLGLQSGASVEQLAEKLVGAVERNAGLRDQLQRKIRSSKSGTEIARAEAKRRGGRVSRSDYGTLEKFKKTKGTHKQRVKEAATRRPKGGEPYEVGVDFDPGEKAYWGDKTPEQVLMSKSTTGRLPSLEEAAGDPDLLMTRLDRLESASAKLMEARAGIETALQTGEATAARGKLRELGYKMEAVSREAARTYRELSRVGVGGEDLKVPENLRAVMQGGLLTGQAARGAVFERGPGNLLKSGTGLRAKLLRELEEKTGALKGGDDWAFGGPPQGEALVESLRGASKSLPFRQGALDIDERIRQALERRGGFVAGRDAEKLGKYAREQAKAKPGDPARKMAIRKRQGQLSTMDELDQLSQVASDALDAGDTELATTAMEAMDAIRERPGGIFSLSGRPASMGRDLNKRERLLQLVDELKNKERPSRFKSGTPRVENDPEAWSVMMDSPEGAGYSIPFNVSMPEHLKQGPEALKFGGEFLPPQVDKLVRLAARFEEDTAKGAKAARWADIGAEQKQSIKQIIEALKGSKSRINDMLPPAEMDPLVEAHGKLLNHLTYLLEQSGAPNAQLSRTLGKTFAKKSRWQNAGSTLQRHPNAESYGLLLDALAERGGAMGPVRQQLGTPEAPLMDVIRLGMMRPDLIAGKTSILSKKAPMVGGGPGNLADLLRNEEALQALGLAEGPGRSQADKFAEIMDVLTSGTDEMSIIQELMDAFS